jgi:hypothetical protein
MKTILKNSNENFLLALLQKVINEYKLLLESARKSKPLKIVEITVISTIPGETMLSIQVTYKNCILNLTAAEIIKNYNLTEFSDYHAEMIRQAAQGKICEFLKITDNKPSYQIISKKLDRETNQFVFTIQTPHGCFVRTADDLGRDKNSLNKMEAEDVYDVGYTHGSEKTIQEEKELLIEKNSRRLYANRNLQNK